jgi:hypothetical protein
MTNAQINLEAVQTIYSAENYRDSGDLETIAAETGGTIEQGWDTEETIVAYPDGSRIVMAGPCCDAR